MKNQETRLCLRRRRAHNPIQVQTAVADGLTQPATATTTATAVSH